VCLKLCVGAGVVDTCAVLTKTSDIPDHRKVSPTAILGVRHIVVRILIHLL
jgi:hypothetical protein